MKRIKIPQASMEDAPLKEKVAEDRNLAIEAAIVRIMKGRRQLEHRLLIQDVLQMLSAFRPQISAIKQRIENLISRDFLERDPQNPQIYLYLA